MKGGEKDGISMRSSGCGSRVCSDNRQSSFQHGRAMSTLEDIFEAFSDILWLSIDRSGSEIVVFVWINNGNLENTANNEMLVFEREVVLYPSSEAAHQTDLFAGG